MEKENQIDIFLGLEEEILAIKVKKSVEEEWDLKKNMLNCKIKYPSNDDQNQNPITNFFMLDRVKKIIEEVVLSKFWLKPFTEEFLDLVC